LDAKPLDETTTDLGWIPEPAIILHINDESERQFVGAQEDPPMSDFWE
jgi:hypothetical protein